MKKIYISPTTIEEEMNLTNNLLNNSNPHINEDDNVVFPGGEGEGGDADDGCVKEINELETELNPFENGLW